MGRVVVLDALCAAGVSSHLRAERLNQSTQKKNILAYDRGFRGSSNATLPASRSGQELNLSSGKRRISD